MRKLRLKLDQLEVETFRTGDAPVPGRGTVDAHAATQKPGCMASVKTDLTCCPCTPLV